MSELAKALINIPSFSPQTGELLLRITEAIDRRISAGGLSPEVIEELKRYSNALEVTIFYSLIHQKAAIDQFEHLLRTMAEDSNQ